MYLLYIDGQATLKRSTTMQIYVCFGDGNKNRVNDVCCRVSNPLSGVKVDSLISALNVREGVWQFMEIDKSYNNVTIGMSYFI